MADTIAVMNKGVIEQHGHPTELYDNPASTFVSNFLGQSNLVRAQVVERSDERVVVDAHGSKVAAPVERAHQADNEVWVGVRPEKVSLVASGSGAEGGKNSLTGGTVTDVSYIGVSTQYLVKLPWGQELTVFEQNTGTHEAFRAGDSVDLSWHAEHTFLLDAAQDALAGAEDFE
jgi:spermidine/putrescine transport system ATP-binding protein